MYLFGGDREDIEDGVQNGSGIEVSEAGVMENGKSWVID